MHGLWKKNNGGQTMANAEKVLYTAGNPLVYEPKSRECAYTELDRENARLMVDRAKLRGELNESRAAFKTMRSRVFWLGVVVGLYTAGGLITIAVLLLR
jgi:hypothetical protein